MTKYIHKHLLKVQSHVMPSGNATFSVSTMTFLASISHTLVMIIAVGMFIVHCITKHDHQDIVDVYKRQYPYMGSEPETVHFGGE